MSTNPDWSSMADLSPNLLKNRILEPNSLALTMAVMTLTTIHLLKFYRLHVPQNGFKPIDLIGNSTLALRINYQLVLFPVGFLKGLFYQ
ncbi:unnamed protein product [Euphydryas editha]|uniref:Uncharacterized protein n=1 Tax=Euphydryas editha TaxID=104508 RepID=A0AAU9TPE4_EUPED|nr:unnamed protein product [Euphydryas editha]